MKRPMIVWCGLLLWVGSILHAAVPDTLTAPRMTTPPTIDGDSGEWQIAQFPDTGKLFLNKDNGVINVGGIDDDKDLSTTTYVAYDDTMLYVLAIAKDDKIDAGNPPATNWKNDCIELWIDGADDVGAFPGQDDNVQINIDVNGVPYVYRDAGLLNKLLPKIVGGAKETKDGYVIEAAIPLGEIPRTKIAAGGQIGFSISFVDSDSGNWNHLLWRGANEVNINEWGKLIFSKETLAVDPAGRLAAMWGDLKR